MEHRGPISSALNALHDGGRTYVLPIYLLLLASCCQRTPTDFSALFAPLPLEGETNIRVREHSTKQVGVKCGIRLIFYRSNSIFTLMDAVLRLDVVLKAPPQLYSSLLF